MMRKGVFITPRTTTTLLLILALCCSGQGWAPYTGLGIAYLGQGIDFMTGRRMSTYVNEDKLLRCKQDGGCESIVEIGTSEYQDFAEVDASKEDRASASKNEASLGIGYGLNIFSLKLAGKYESSSSKTVGVFRKRVGLVKKRSYYLPVNTQGDVKKTNQLDRNITAEALLYSSSDLKRFIGSINQAYMAGSAPQFNILVQKFYQDFGTHFISSVTRGHIGYAEITLTYDGTQKDSMKSVKTSVEGITESGITGSAGFAHADSSLFANDSFTYKSITYASPDKQETRKSLEKLQAEADKEINNQKNQYDFKRLDPQKYKSLMTYPDLPNIPAPSEAQMKKAQDKWKFKWDKNLKIKQLEDGVEQIKKIVKTAVGQADYDQKEQGLCDALKKISEIIQEIDKKADDVSFFTSSDTAIVQLARLIADTLKENKFTADCKASFTHALAQKLDSLIQQKEASIKADEEKKKEVAGAPNFIKWLIDVKFKEYQEKEGANNNNPGNNEADVAIGFQGWLRNLSAAETKKMHEEWEKIADKKDDPGQPDSLLMANLVMPGNDAKKSDNSASTATSTSGNEDKDKDAHKDKDKDKDDDEDDDKDKNVKNAEEYATLDFDITPWQDVFPILNAVLTDNYWELLLLKLLDPINEFLEARAYLQVVKNTLSDSAQLDNWYAEDTEREADLRKLVESIIQSGESEGLIVDYNSKKYQLKEAESLQQLEGLIQNKLKSSKMTASGWYKAAVVLLRNGLIAPYGSLLISDTALIISNEGRGTVTSSSLKNKNFGEQLARSDLEEVFTVMPILKYSSEDIYQTSVISEDETIYHGVLPIVYLGSNNMAVSFKDEVPIDCPRNKILSDDYKDLSLYEEVEPLMLLTNYSKTTTTPKYRIAIALYDKDSSTYNLMTEYPLNDRFRCVDDTCSFDGEAQIAQKLREYFNAPITPNFLSSLKSSNPKYNQKVQLFYEAGLSISRQIVGKYGITGKSYSSIPKTQSSKEASSDTNKTPGTQANKDAFVNIDL